MEEEEEGDEEEGAVLFNYLAIEQVHSRIEKEYAISDVTSHTRNLPSNYLAVSYQSSHCYRAIFFDSNSECFTPLLNMHI